MCFSARSSCVTLLPPSVTRVMTTRRDAPGTCAVWRRCGSRSASSSSASTRCRRARSRWTTTRWCRPAAPRWRYVPPSRAEMKVRPLRPRRDEGTLAQPRRDEGTLAQPRRDEGTLAQPRRDEGTLAQPRRDEGTSAPAGQVAARRARRDGSGTVTEKVSWSKFTEQIFSPVTEQNSQMCTKTLVCFC